MAPFFWKNGRGFKKTEKQLLQKNNEKNVFPNYAIFYDKNYTHSSNKKLLHPRMGTDPSHFIVSCNVENSKIKKKRKNSGRGPHALERVVRIVGIERFFDLTK